MWKKILAFFLLLLLSVVQVKAEDCENLTSKERIDCFDAKVKQLGAQGDTLASTIAYLNSKMALTEAQINQTETELKKLEEEISLLSVKIVRLDENLTNISKLLVSRIGASYKRSLFKPIYMVFATGGLSDFFERNKYLQSIQQNDRVVLLELQNSKDQHEQQKKIEEEKQAQAENLKKKLAEQNKALITQRQSKEELLRITKNDEKKYQALLTVAREEYAAIQGIIAGKGVETEIGHVNEGEKIATIIQGPSCNSSGAHLHFIIAENGSVKNPFNYLSNIDYVNCSGAGECSSADTFNPSGDWTWPINARVKFSQGYGMTWAIQNTWVGKIYQFHNGIDINSESASTVKAVKKGQLYKGSYSGWNGCVLPYVRINHDDSDLDTFYLHAYH
ncbi:MAG: hypothetical protein KKB74_13690 [Bacteroidetes bacterium]|nr:hypothetical protein [Bacteroidota bacterium]